MAEPQSAPGTKPQSTTARVHRFEVRSKPAFGDPLGDGVKRDAAHVGVSPGAVRTAKVYLVKAALSQSQVERVKRELLANSVLEECADGAAPVQAGEQLVEVLPLPGVMDPTALTVQDAVRELTGLSDIQVSTGVRYDFAGITSEQADRLAKRLLSNAAIQAVHRSPYQPVDFPQAQHADQTVRHVSITKLSDDELLKLSREGHLFLSLDEMRAIQAEYRRLGREPRDIELETLAQTWSEHCVHKTLKSTVTYKEASGNGHRASAEIDWLDRPGVTVNADGSVKIANLLKSTVAAATFELIDEGIDWTLSVFKDNSGVIRFDDQTAVCVKVETHNHPSAIEPYGGAATGVGGCIRDVIGTGLGAKPIANTDVFCVAMPGMKAEDVPNGCLHPRRVLTRVIDGVRDYGNRMGIPTVNGAVYFDDRYIGNPLVYCGCVGVLPTWAVKGKVQSGDRIVALGGRTGRDGIHGATFSSAELTDTHADEFSHAVQIGNAITEKRVLDAILRARDYVPSGASGSGHRAAEGSTGAQCPMPSARTCLYNALTDCGAGGFSSAVGEMGGELGAEVHLDHAPLKYEGLRYDEIWISESQERMVLAVPPKNMDALRRICEEEGVELADLGHFGTPNRELVLFFRGSEVGRMDMHFLHDGIPMPVREAVWTPSATPPTGRGLGRGNPSPASSSTSRPLPQGERGGDIASTLLSLLAHPNIASKRWIVRQYDHEVQGNTAVKPLVGAGGIGPGDATVIKPVPGSKQGLGIACGLQVPVGDVTNGGDPYLMALAAVDECVRNLVCVGVDPERIAILDNFCWPSCGKPQNMASLVRAAVGCYDAAKAYATPFVSGKDSLNNQFRTEDGKLIEIPPTLLISGIGVVPDVSECVTMDLKAVPDTRIVYLRPSDEDLTQPNAGATVARVVANMIKDGIVLAAHDVSEGGPLVALAEMLIAGAHDRDTTLGLCVNLGELQDHELFREHAGGYLLQVRDDDEDLVWEIAREPEDVDLYVNTEAAYIENPGILRLESDQSDDERRIDIPVADLRKAFLGTLDW